MHIVTGSDNNYVPGVMVLIASAARHTPDVRFTVLDMGISPENRARLDALGDRLGVSVGRIEVSEDVFSDLPVLRAHLTRSAYLRILIPALIPNEDRVIYMDCDMVVMDDLTPLDRMALDDNLVAAVPCPSPAPVELSATGHVKGSYVNSGLLVMNLPLWREERIADRCMERLSDSDNPLLFEDQSAINIVCRGRIVPLPLRYNMYSDPSSYDRVEDLPPSAAVIHYVVNNKPWNSPAIVLGEVWHNNAAAIGDLMPPLKPVTWRRRLSLWNRARRDWVGLTLGREKYHRRERVRRAMMDRIARPYLEKWQGRV